MKAGDIIASRNNECGSWFIRKSTRSNWSHVAIATTVDLVLEAVPTSDHKDEVREMRFTDLFNSSDQIIVFERPQTLSTDQIYRLDNYAKSAKEKNYTIGHAVLTMAGSFIWASAATFFLLSALQLFSINRELGGSFGSYCLALTYVFFFFAIWAVVNIWSLRTNFGVPTTEKLFNKTRYGRYLVKRKHDMFCSKLVLLADKHIGGPISPNVHSPEEVLPKHIVKACEEMRWCSQRYK